ncbi:MAG TPA: nucleotidyltransferase domain-containing protein [Puia sp.]|nr:nucleotidyltransferase domain-containing protein [Puia sp.]
MHLSTNDRLLLQDFFAGLPVKKAFVFGSYARNSAINKNSDLDILVELDHSTPIGMKFFSYQSELEQLMKRKVDLVSSEGLSKHVQPHIDMEKILIYERSGSR